MALAQIKHPKGSDAVTSQAEGDRRHIRGTDAKDYDQVKKMKQEAGGPHAGREEDERARSGPDARDTMGGRPDLVGNPGIGSSAGTTDSGESGISETDRGRGLDRNE